MDQSPKTPKIRFLSFGYKWGDEPPANILFDCRRFKNPFYEPELRELNGSHTLVVEFMLAQPEVPVFLEQFRQRIAAPTAQQCVDGHSDLEVVIAFGCTGGKHRSQFFAIHCADIVREEFSIRCQPFSLEILHRDAGKE